MTVRSERSRLQQLAGVAVACGMVLLRASSCPCGWRLPRGVGRERESNCIYLSLAGGAMLAEHAAVHAKELVISLIYTMQPGH